MESTICINVEPIDVTYIIYRDPLYLQRENTVEETEGSAPFDSQGVANWTSLFSYLSAVFQS